MDEGDDEYVDPNLYSAFGVDSVLNVPASPIRGSPPRLEDVDNCGAYLPGSLAP